MLEAFYQVLPILLEMEFFRGVKVSQLAPLALFCIIYILRFGYDRPIRDMSENETYISILKHW